MIRTILILAAALVVGAGAHASSITETFTASPHLAIPDAQIMQPGMPVSHSMEVIRPRYIDEIRVYIRLATQESSDLRIWVTSAYDTTVELFFIGEGGEPGVDPAGWYPTDFTPREDLNVWLGEGMSGTWTITCQDWSYGVASTLEEWRLEFGYDDAVAGERTTWSGVKALFE